MSNLGKDIYGTVMEMCEEQPFDDMTMYEDASGEAQVAFPTEFYLEANCPESVVVSVRLLPEVKDDE